MSIEVIDLFCGIGGLTSGLKKAGLNVIAGFDLDPTCKFAYEKNNNVAFYEKNIREIKRNDILSCFKNKTAIKVLVGCAPCQPFSQMTIKFKKNKKKCNDEKYDLLLEFGRLINDIKPTIVSMENVPQIKNTIIFKKFLKILNQNKYFTNQGIIVYCPDYGIPQNRRRFVLLASKLGNIELIPSTHNRKKVSINKFIKKLPKLESGEVNDNDPLHKSAKLSEKNLLRIRASKPGGTWNDWPKELMLECHKKNSGKTYTSVYGRMKWNKIGPTITTKFFSYGTGRFGHPDQDRALSLREGALLQTFPVRYNFIDPDSNFSINDIARHIGNAVPVRLGEVIGLSIIEHLIKNGIKI